MLSGRYQIMWSHSHLMWFLAPGYSQLIWSQKPDVIGSCDLCYRAATANDPEISSTTTATAAAAVGRGGSDAPRFFMLSLPYIPHSAPPNCVCLIPRRG